MLDACAKLSAASSKRLDVPVEYAKTAMRVIAMAAFSGLRKGEIQGLRWEHLQDGKINVQQSAWRTTIIEPTKTAASTDSVPVLGLLADHLEAHRNGFPAQGFIFVGPKMGRPLDLANLASRIVRPILKDAGIPWCGWHGFRRGLATNLHALGVDDLDIMRIMRHSDVEVTRASYIKVPDAAKAAAMAKLQKVLGTAGTLGTDIGTRQTAGDRKSGHNANKH
jgi:integrase